MCSGHLSMDLAWIRVSVNLYPFLVVRCHLTFCNRAGESPLARANSTKDLGMLVGTSMQFESQISAVVNKCLRILGLIKNVSRDFRCASTLIKRYKSLLLISITYCSSIWLPYTEVALGEQMSIEHKFLRFMSKLTPVPMQCTFLMTNIRYT